MKKLICMLMLLTMLTGCASAQGANIAALKGPTAIGMVEMMENDADFSFEICASADEITPRFVRGEIDIAALPANLAAVLYQRTEGRILALGINTLGVMYIAERGENVRSVGDLAGKTIYSAGKGSVPEYALNHILKMNGLEPGRDVTIEWRAEHAECLAALMNDASAVAMLPQPFVTTAMTKAPDMRMALDLTAEWDKLGTGSSMITGVVAVRKEFAQEHPEVVRNFMENYRESVDFVNANPAEAAVLVEKYGIVPAAVAEKAIPYCNICLIEGDEMEEKLGGYLEVLFDQDNASVGGKLPDGDFYYHAEG